MGDSSIDIFYLMSKTKVDSFEVNWSDLKKLHFAYLSWQKQLRATPWATRGSNIPEAITEAVVCLCTGAKLKSGTKGDILLPDDQIGEVKATTLDQNDLTSFSPTSPFDNLYFVRFSFEDPYKYFVYDLHMSREDLLNLKVNSNETFGDHSTGKRRPRLSIIENIIKPRNLKPTWIVNIQDEVITKYN